MITPVLLYETPREYRERNSRYKNKKDYNYKQMSETVDYKVLLTALNASKEKSLERYDIARDYFQKNYQNGKPLLGTVQELELVESNEKIRCNVCKFLIEKSDEEIKKLSSKKILTREDRAKLKGYKQINGFFREYLPLLSDETFSGKDISFSGTLGEKDEKICKRAVHATAGACSLVSAAAGACSMGFADAPILRTIQGGMFLGMQQYLKVPFIASAEYIAKEMYSGAIIGIEGARILTDIFSGTAHAASVATGVSVYSGGSSHVAISKAAGLAHGSLSFMITEKMGRGYIKRVKNNQMNFRNQTAEVLGFFGMKAIFGGVDSLFNIDSIFTVDNAADPEFIKSAYENMSDENKDLIVNFVDMLKDFNASKLGISFSFNFISNYALNAAGKDNKLSLKDNVKKSFKDAFLLTAVYDLYDYGTGELATEKAKAALVDMKAHLQDYPEVYEKFKLSENEFLKNIDFNRLDDRSFQNQFKNRTFLSTISYMTTADIKVFTNRWKHKRDKEFNDRMKSVKNGMQEQSKIEESKKEQRQQTAKFAQEYIEALKNQYQMAKTENDFGFNRIGGYKDLKNRIEAEFFVPLSIPIGADASKPSGVILYGATNTGKTVFAQGIIEQAQCKKQNLPSMFSDTALCKKLDYIINDADAVYKKKGQKTIIKIDEIDALENKPKAKFKLLEILDDENSPINVIGTTNSPEKLSKELKSYFSSYYLAPALKEDAKEILRHYLPDNKEIDIEKIAQKLSEVQNAYYCNAQIEQFAKYINSHNTAAAEEIYKLIKATKPEITKDDIKKYEGAL